MMTAEELKNSILRMAVEGKLTEQYPEDNSAAKFIKDTQNRKEFLIKQKVFKKAKPQEKLTEDDLPFEIPENWKWCQVGDFFSNASGLSYKKGLLAEKSNHMVRILRGGNIGKESYSFKEDDQFIKRDYVKDSLYLKKGYMITPAVTSLNHIGKIGLIDRDYDDVVVGGFVLMLMPYFDNDVASKYFLYAFDTKEHRDACKAITHKSGQAFYNLSREKLMNLPVPIPPLEEMSRIVAKIEELMPFVDQYAASSEKLNTLNVTFPDQMKKSILQEAVQGKLVPQDPSDEPASVLLEKIAEEKKKLIKEGKIKKQKKLPPITEDEIPFEIPESWEWVRLGEVANLLSGFAFKSPEFLTNGCYRLLRGINLGVGSTRWDDTVYIDKIPEKLRAYIIEQGDVLLGLDRPWISDGIRVDIFNGPENTLLVQRVLRIREIGAMINRYIAILLRSQLFKEAVANDTTGISVPHISQRQVSNVIVPLPPLKEQIRIANRVDELIPLAQELRE